MINRPYSYGTVCQLKDGMDKVIKYLNYPKVQVSNGKEKAQYQKEIHTPKTEVETIFNSNNPSH